MANDTSTTVSVTTTTSPAIPGTTPPPGSDGAPIIIGVEYVVLDSPDQIERQAELLGEVGFGAAKPLPEAISWGNMQRGPDSEIDFSKLDDYVEAFQGAGFVETVVALKSHSTWASVDHSLLQSRDVTPKPEFREAYAAWVGAVVERYDGDGVDDMPGLLYPIRHYEIGSEFTSYEPEPVEDYLVMLEIAYEAAHAAFSEVRVSHAAFLVADALLGDPAFESLDDAAIARYGPHSFREIRSILDHPELFDAVNVHALAHPGEIEQLVRWLDWEMDQRGYDRPIIISDTSINPFVAFGPAIDCQRPPALMGIVIYPATEADRCRLAAYFTRALDGDAETLAWMRRYAAADMVKKVVIAADQGVELIDTAFTGDLPILSWPVGQAAAGNAGWGGMIELPSGNTHANFHAMQQLIRHIDGYTAVRRVDVGGPEGTRVYEFVVAGARLWVAWYDPPFLVVHPDPPLPTTVIIPTGAGTFEVESMIGETGQTEPTSESFVAGPDGVTIVVEQSPVFVSAG
ncbi:MAG: hypothetical protein HZA58_03210 [Acidimicrobiia bacterium]|nr:hypothetical protein [Acidimicrobiia bacterium]